MPSSKNHGLDARLLPGCCDMPAPSDTTRAYALLLVMPLFFSTNLVIGRAVVGEVHPWTLACLRWALAVLILLPFTARSLMEHRAVLLAHWERLGILGVLGMWICGAIVYLSLTATTATNATLIYTTSPVLVILIETLVLRRRLPMGRLIGVAAAIVGVAIIVLRGDLAALARLELNPGDVGIAVAALAWAVYSLVLRHEDLARVPTLTLFAAIMIAGVIGLLPFMIWETAVLGDFPTTGQAWAAIAALAVFPSVAAFSLYQYGVKVVGPGVTSCFLYLLPPYGVAMAIFMLGESFHGYHLAGSVLVVVGLVIATLPPGLVDTARARLLRQSPVTDGQG